MRMKKDNTGGIIEKGAAKAAEREENPRSRSTSDGKAGNGPRKPARTGRSSNSSLRGNNGRDSRTGSMSGKPSNK